MVHQAIEWVLSGGLQELGALGLAALLSALAGCKDWFFATLRRLKQKKIDGGVCATVQVPDIAQSLVSFWLTP